MSVSVPVIGSWDGEARRVYLKSGLTSFHWIDDIYKEYRNWRRTVEASRKWLPCMRAAGNDPKGGGKYTPRYITLLDGFRVVPYDENILIEVLGEAITDNSDVDPDPFDTSTRTQPLKLYITPPAAEIVRSEADSAASIWDEPLCNHLLPGSIGLALKHGSVSTLRDPIARGGTLNSIIFDIGASSDTDAYNNALIVINNGTGMGQSRTIVSYDGITKTAYVSLNWVVIPDNTSEFSIIADSGPLIIVSGRVESSTNTTLVLAPVVIMSIINNVYNGQFVLIASGLNAGQTRRIVGYVANTRTITVHEPWHSNPTAEDTYQIIPHASVKVNDIDTGVLSILTDSIWNEALEGSHTAKSVMRYLLSFISGVATGAGTAEITFKSANGLVNRIVMSVDAEGNRTAVVLSGVD